MKTHAGLWIDHRHAVVVLLTDGVENVQDIQSGVEKHVHFSGGNAAELGSTEDVRDRQFQNHLNTYYDEVIAVIREAEAIQIFGPGEAKGELEKRLQHAGLAARTLPVETTDKMTALHIAEKVRTRFAG
ncbi:MAG: hypothetical protein IPP94_16850 [Ignavibacteria bacterium]|nr:hypothetical protein [Ignavibacteria bacterium]